MGHGGMGKERPVFSHAAIQLSLALILAFFLASNQAWDLIARICIGMLSSIGIQTAYVNPLYLIYVRLLDGTIAGFEVLVECSGLITMLVYAFISSFTIGLLRGNLVVKLVWFVLSIGIGFLWNICRLTSVISVAYYYGLFAFSFVHYILAPHNRFHLDHFAMGCRHVNAQKRRVCMIFTSIIFILSLVMVAYMVRHIIFTYSALFGKPKQFIRSFKRIVGVYTPKVTVLIPAHNEEMVIGNLLERMAALTYPKDKLEVLVIDDGSTDETGNIADSYAKGHSYIRVIHRANGGKGKAVALNEGMRFSNGEVILTFDADYYPQLDIIEKLVAPFADPEVGAVQGRVTVVNEEDSVVSKIVTLERIGGYRVDQQARDELVLVPQYGGTVGGFRREALEKIGGWDFSMLAEDTDLTIKLVLRGYQVRYVNEAEAYEEAVTTWRAYWNQRYRWAKGHMQCARKHLVGVLRAKHLSGYEKAELTLLLCVYFMPILVLMAWVVGVGAYLTKEAFISSNDLGLYFLILSIFTYSTVGNFAPFFEVGSAAYLDNRRRLLWVLPVLVLAFIVMVFCSSKALLDLLFTGNKQSKWNHTFHNGNGVNGRNSKNNKHPNCSGRLPL